MNISIETPGEKSFREFERTNNSVISNDKFTPRVNIFGKVLLKSMTLPQLEDYVVDVLQDKKFRARQLWRWMYHPSCLSDSFEKMTVLSKEFRAKLEENCAIDSLELDKVHQAADGTRKLTFKLVSQPGGGIIETVLIPSEDRATLCVSSQLGCALNCQFCHTGKMGLQRHLGLEEIVDQLVITKRLFDHEQRISNIVYMGLGEPMHNLENVLKAVDVMVHDQGLHMSHNKVTVSTSGLIPEMRRFIRESKANLAVSLNASNDEVRSWIMPINRKYNLDSLMSMLAQEFPRRGDNFGKLQHKVFFEYIMLKGVNDSLEDAKNILRITAKVPSKINLIRFNTHEGSEFQGSDESTILEFQNYLKSKGKLVTIRESRGDDAMMACGQLGKLGDKPMPPRMKVPERYRKAVSIKAHVAK
eukprot:CAMPEP_0182448704 /NCGR_PEP_ID=MMETSP1172-20130603/28998_1 /TAXON_ID=708627 /ORGANISM="Timspurckia oligopyrenoides, Strain CCMP3278" /LENGTH=415 /DNA_ID=CAMNT_0024645663 /DNA_START=137 /DNA_END=1384 /DNA_ORIENTATION=+